MLIPVADSNPINFKDRDLSERTHVLVFHESFSRWSSRSNILAVTLNVVILEFVLIFSVHYICCYKMRCKNCIDFIFLSLYIHWLCKNAIVMNDERIKYKIREAVNLTGLLLQFNGIYRHIRFVRVHILVSSVICHNASALMYY